MGKGKYFWQLPCVMAAFIALAGANTIFAAGRDICVDAAKGDDAGGTGSSGAPFKTLQRAVSKLREINKDNKNDINVRIAPGDYFIDKEIHLDNSCGGGIYWHVNFIGNPKDMPRIIGGRKITEWENLGNGTFASRIGKGLKKFTLIENGKPAREASYPNSGYIQALDGGKNEKGESFVTIDPALLKVAGENMTIAIWPGCHNRVGSNYNWSQIRARPKSIDKSSGKIESGYVRSDCVVASEQAGGRGIHHYVASELERVFVGFSAEPHLGGLAVDEYVVFYDVVHAVVHDVPVLMGVVHVVA